MDRYPLDDTKLAKLAGSRSGRVALAGFEYQRAFAILRLAALALRQPVPGCIEVPRLLRYEWAEDIDEVGSDDRIILWQCKHGDDWHSPRQLAEILLGFAPKWLWTSEDQRNRLDFRLVTSDRAFAAHHDLPGALPDSDALRNAFLLSLAQSPSPRTDRAQWQSEADAIGHELLFEALLRASGVAYMPGLTVAGPRIWTAERRALDALAQSRWVSDPGQANEISGALRLLLDVHVTHVPAADGTIYRSARAPRWLRPYEVEHRLHQFAPGPALAHLDLVDRPRLEHLLTQPPGRPFVARQPEWSDVVRGPDTYLRFFERMHTEALEHRVLEALTASHLREGGLRFLPVLGEPGAGKSTLVLRVAAKLVLEGHCLAIDLRHPLDSKEDTGTLVDTLLALGEGEQPVLLVLDDPLSADSGWPSLLQMLGRHRTAIVALAATPTFLHDRYRHVLRSPIQELSPWILPPPDQYERTSLAALYPASSTEQIAESEEGLLVIAMQAAAGESFDTIVSSLWRTLADGRPISTGELGASLPWPVAAFALVCWFHRAYVRCPLPLLQAFLTQRPDVAGDADERVRTMALKHGWRIFQVQNCQSHSLFAFGSGSVTTMHSRVAQRSWELRPATGWDIEQAIAQASAASPASARQLGAALIGLRLHAPKEVERLLTKMARPWTDTTNAAIETKYLCELTDALGANADLLPKWLLATLLQRATIVAADSWLAALSLYTASHYLSASRRFPESVSLTALISAGDFSIAPARVKSFFSAIVRQDGLRENFIQHLWDAFEGKRSWQIPKPLITWLLRRDREKFRVSKHIGAIRKWLLKHPDDREVRLNFVGLLGTLGIVERAERTAAVSEIRDWLRENKKDSTVRTAFLSVTSARNKLVEEIDVDEGLQWMADNPHNPSFRATLTALLLHRNDRRLAHILKENLIHAKQHTSTYHFATISIKACIMLPARQLDLICDWLDWASATLCEQRGNYSALTIARSTLQPFCAVERHLRKGSGTTIDRDRARITLWALEETLIVWYASVSKEPILPH